MVEPPEKPDLPEPTPLFELHPPAEPDLPLPDEPPLDPYESEELHDALDYGWGEFGARAYNLLRAAQLIA